jgi:pilus assembly protein CpaC
VAVIAAIASLSIFLICGRFLRAAAQEPSARPAGPAQAAEVTLTVGKSILIDSALPIERVSVGFGEVAEAAVVSPNEVLLNGKAPGETTLIVWQRGGSRLLYNVFVNPSHFLANSRLEAIRSEIAKELPGQKVNLSVEGDLIFLRGNVKDLTSADRAMAIASTLGKTVNLLYVDVPEAEAQILLRVRFASVDRSASTELGLNLFSTGAGNTVGSVSTGQFSAPSVSQSSTTGQTTFTLSDALNLFLFRRDLNLGATIKALQTKGLVEVLAEPNVLAQNGKLASFLAGGEYPFPMVQGATGAGTGAVTIQFKEYGVRLNFVPTITPRKTIQLQVVPEVSSLDFADGVNISGFQVPALTVRRVETAVELSDGQSFAIGGLLDNRDTVNFSKIPFIGDLPILGKFFQSKSVQKQNTELIVIVTPELVRPIPAGAPVPELHYPDKFLAPNSNKDATRTPGIKTTGPVPMTPPTPSIPFEKLIETLRPDPPIPANGSGTRTTDPMMSPATPLAPAASPAAPAGLIKP